MMTSITEKEIRFGTEGSLIKNQKIKQTQLENDLYNIIRTILN